MNKKAILKFNSPKSARPVAWLAMAILACGAFENSVQAQAWLNESFSNYSVDATLSTTTSPNLINAGSFSLYTKVINDGGNVARYSKTSGSTGSQVMFGFSPNTGAITARTSGYVSFKVKQNINAAVANTLTLDVGIGNATAATTTSSGANRLIGLAFKQTGTTAGAVTISKGDGAANTTVASSVAYANSTSFCTVQVWFNDSDTATMPYIDPAGNSQTLSINSFAVYVNNNLVGSSTLAGAFATSGTLNIGKIGFSTPSGTFIDFSFDDIYAGSAAPFAIISPTTASGQVGSSFSYKISSSSPSTATYRTTTPLPGGLSLDASGVISGTPTSAGVYPITIYTTVGGVEVSAPLTISISGAYTWSNEGTSWSASSSWTNGAVPTTLDTAIFGAVSNSPTSVDVGAGNAIGGIVFSNNAYAYTWTGTDIKVLSSGAITNNSSVAQTFGNKMINSGNATWSSVASGSSMVFNGGIDLSDSSTSSTLTFAGAGNATVNSAIVNGGGSTAGGVTFTSTGTNLLSGNNTYGGATTISSGATLKIGSATALGSTTGSTVVSAGGTLDLNGQTVSSESLSLDGTGTITINGALSTTNGALANTSINNASWSGPVTLVSSATYMNASSGKITVSGVVSGGSKGITKIGAGTLELSGANTYTGTTDIQDGTTILSGANSSTLYKIGGNYDNLNTVLKVTAPNLMSSSANLLGITSIARTGTLELAPGNYTLNAYTGNNMNFSKSSGSSAALTFTNLNNTLSAGGGRTLTNLSTDLTVTFNGQLDIGGNSTDNCTISAIGPVVISNRIYSLSNTVTRSFVKKETGTLTIYGTNSYNGTTTVSGGTLRIPTGGSLVGCGDTIVKGSGTVSATSASLNLGGAAGVVQVSTNGFVRGDTSVSPTTLGTISSLQVQNAGTVEVALGNIWSTGGTIEFASGSKVSVTGTPVVGQGPYTLMTASTAITGSAPTLNPLISGWTLKLNGLNLVLEEVPLDQFQISEGVTTTFSAILDGSLTLNKTGLGTAIITGDNTFTGGTILQAGTLRVGHANGLGTGAVTLTSGTLGSTVNLDLGKLTESTTSLSTGFQAVYGGTGKRLQYTTVQSTTINGPVTLDVGNGTTMTMGTLIGNSSLSSLVTKIGAGTVKLMGGSTKLADMAPNGNASSVLGGWRIQDGTVWFNQSANNGGGNGSIILAGGTAKFSRLQNSNGTYTGFDVPSDLTVESSGLIQFDPDPVTLLGQNNLGFGNLSIGSNTLTVATATTSSPTMVGQGLPRVNFASATLTGSATLNNPVNLDLNLQAVSGAGGFTKTGLGTLYLSDQPNQAAAFATLTSGGVGSVTVEYAGSGYAVPPAAAPAVTLVAVNGVGSGAQATATIDSNGRVTSIAVTAAGSGYVSVPRVVIAAPPTPTVATANSYAGATIVNEGKLNLSGSYVSSVTVKSGAALQLDWLAPAQAKCSIDGISPTSTTITSTTASYSYVKDLYLTKSVGGYVPNTPFEFDLPAPAKVDGTGTATGTATYVLEAARARATVGPDGFISALSIVNGGSGYAVTPMVTIPAPTVPTVVARTTKSILFEQGALLSLNIASPTSASYTLFTADEGITGTPELETPISGYTLTKSSDGKSLLLQNTKTTPTITVTPAVGGYTYSGLMQGPGVNEVGTGGSRGGVTLSYSGTGSTTYGPSDIPPINAGAYTLTATVASDSSYNEASSTPTAFTIARAAQTITGLAATDDSKTYGGIYMDFDLTVTKGASTSALSYSSSNTGVATIHPTTGSVHIVGAGTTTLTVNQAADANYNAATAVTQILTVGKADQTITGLAATDSKTFGAADYTLAVTKGASSSALSFASSATGVATVNPTTGLVHVVGAGTTTLTVNQAGDANYNAATAVTQTLTVTQSGTTFASWSGNAALTSDLVYKYAFGAADKNSAAQKMTSGTTASTLSLTAVVRTDDSKLVITPKSVSSLSGTWSATDPVISVVNAADQTGLGTGLVRKVYTVDRGTDSKRFLKLEAVYTQ